MILDILKKIFHIGGKVTETVEAAIEFANEPRDTVSQTKQKLALSLLKTIVLKTDLYDQTTDVVHNFIIEANLFLKKYNGHIEFYEEGINNIIKITYPKIAGMKIENPECDAKASTKTHVNGQITDPIPNKCSKDTRGL